MTHNDAEFGRNHAGVGIRREELGYRTLRRGGQEQVEPVNRAAQIKFENVLARLRQR